MGIHPPLLHSKQGFTLLETVLYTLIVTILMSSFIFIMQATVNTQRKFKSHALLHENLRFALQKIESRVHAASAITYPLRGNTGTRLVLTMNESSKNPTTFELSNGQLILSEGTTSNVLLTTGETEIQDFTVTHVATSPSSLRLTVTARTNADSAAQNTSTTIRETMSLRR